MKKKLIILALPLIGLNILYFTNGANCAFSKDVTLFEQAQACVAHLECNDGSEISCTGSKTCEGFAYWVVCDGNQTSECGAS